MTSTMIICPKCESHRWKYVRKSPINPYDDTFRCQSCGYRWKRYVECPGCLNVLTQEEIKLNRDGEKSWCNTCWAEAHLFIGPIEPSCPKCGGYHSPTIECDVPDRIIVFTYRTLEIIQGMHRRLAMIKKQATFTVHRPSV